MNPITLYLSLMAFVVLGLLTCYACPDFVSYANLPQTKVIAAIIGLFSLSVLVLT